MSRTTTARWKKFRATLIHRAGPVITCHYCGADLDPKAPPCTPSAIEIDHVVPFVLDPSREFDPTNCVLSCFPCNRTKNKRTHPTMATSEIRRSPALKRVAGY